MEGDQYPVELEPGVIVLGGIAAVILLSLVAWLAF